MSKNKKMWMNSIRSRGYQGYDQMSIIDVISADYYWVQSSVETAGAEVDGDGAANGTSICTLSIPAGTYFLLTHIVASTDVGAMIRVGSGSLAAMTDYYVIDLMSGGGFHLITDKMPIVRIDNRSGTSALTLYLYAPQEGKNAATNNDANHHFAGYMGGIAYGGVTH